MPKFERGRSKTGGRKAGTPNTATGEVRAPAQRLLNSPKYRRAFRARLEELPVASLLDAARARSGLVNVVAVLIPQAPAAHGGFLEWGDLPVLDAETAAAIAPLLEAVSLRAALGELAATCH
jgi:hypothetical protein